MNFVRTGLAASVLNGKIYAIGGRDNHGFGMNAVEVCCNPVGDWTPAGAMLQLRDYLAAADANGLIYAIGGGSLNSVEQYSPATTLFSFIKN